MWCEMCSTVSRFEFRQHKGQTQLNKALFNNTVHLDSF